MRDEKTEIQAARLYDPDLPYHNFGHIRTVIKKGEEIVNNCRKENIDIDDAVVYYALLYHDAGYRDDHAAKGYASKEAYSADLAETELLRKGMDGGKVQKIKSAIMCTHVDARCKSNEDKAVRAADLAELTADYEVFKKNTLDLKKELEMMKGSPISWEEWKILARERVELFLREDLQLTSDYFDADGNSVFQKNARRNLQTMLSDESEQM
jgi:predicted metal-dependent HD superfamily phosphohydrolase